ncbi:MAG: Ig-like domain-containing protein [Chloroflexi bacterium]|nr:Ig-like domain-containing protein [Chloroflexota bacterium]
MAKGSGSLFAAFIFMFSILFAACGGPTLQVVITSPLSDSQFAEGDEVVVAASATGQDIERIQLLVDGELVDEAVSPAPQNSFSGLLQWKAKGEGSHTLQAIAINSTGSNSEPSAITVEVVVGIAGGTPVPTPTALTLQTPTPSTTSAPTFTPSPTATPTSTPTATPTATPVAQISFTADDTSITLDQCTDLHWDVHNIKEVYLITGGGAPEGVAGESQTRNVCPTATTTYTLRVKKLDDSIVEQSIAITVNTILVTVKFTSFHILDDSDSDAAFCVIDCGDGEIWFEFKVNGVKKRLPTSGELDLGSGDAQIILLPIEYELHLGLNSQLTIQVKAFDADAFGTDSLGTVQFTLPAPPSFTWTNSYGLASTMADGQFEIGFDVTGPPPIIIPFP